MRAYRKSLAAWLLILVMVVQGNGSAWAGEAVQEAPAAEAVQEAPAIEEPGNLTFSPPPDYAELKAEGGAQDFHLDLMASSDGAQKVKALSKQANESYGSILTLSCDVAELQRDYDQKLVIHVTNQSDNPARYYLECTNPNDDLFMNFVQNGSKEAPLTIQPNETQDVDLSIFAQNATRSSYSIYVTGHVEGSTETTRLEAKLTCRIPEVKLNITREGSELPGSLVRVYNIHNPTSTPVTDITLDLEGDLADYARISPAVENYELEGYGDTEVNVVPDLAKISANHLETVSGSLVAKGGASGRAEITYDLKDKVINAATLRELAFLQSDNPFKDMEYAEDESLAFLTASGDQVINFADVTNQYYDPEDPENPEKDGVNTKEEFEEVANLLFDDNGMMNFTIADNVTYTDEHGVSQTAPMTVTVSTDIVPDTEENQAAAGGSPTSVRIYEKDGKTYVETIYQMSLSDYKKETDQVRKAANILKIEKYDDIILNNDPKTTSGKIRVKVTDSVQSSMISYPANMAKYMGEGKYLTPSQLSEFYSFSDYAESGFYQSYSKANKAAKYINTGMDVIDTSRVWASRNATVDQKVGYTGLVVARNANRYFGGKLLGKTGAYVGTAIGDGPGTIIGYVVGNVISGLIDFGLGEMIKNLENEIDGQAVYYDVYGRQCTNVGSITSEIYVYDFEEDDPPQIWETGRMYDKNPGKYYVNRQRVGYDYYINGSKVKDASSANEGLTQVTIVDLTPGSHLLKPGRNTIVRDYDTDPGTHYVTADTEVTLIYPDSTTISYVGDNPANLGEVRRLPDFAVYRENITTAETPIIGEENALILNIYNRGSLGGWVDVKINDGDKDAVLGEDIYVEAFSEKTVSLPWIPESPGEKTITASLINKWDKTPERKTDNNTAQTKIRVRNRMTPSIDAIDPDEAYPDDNGRIYLSARVRDAVDMAEALVTVDGKALSGVKCSMKEDDSAQISAVAGNLSTGDHQVNVMVRYLVSQNQYGEITRTETLKVKEKGEISFRVDETIVNPKFYYIDLTYESSLYNLAVEKDGNGYLLKQSEWMAAYPEGYALIVACDGGMVCKRITELRDAVLSLKGAKKVSVTDSKEKASREQLSLQRLYIRNGEKLYEHYYSKTFGGEAAFAGIERIEAKGNYTMPCVGSASLYTPLIQEETLSQDSLIDVADYYALYELKMDTGEEGEYYSPYTFITKTGDQTNTLSTYRYSYDPGKQILSLIFADQDSYEYYRYATRAKNADSLKAYIRSSKGLYLAQFKGSDSSVTVDGAGNHKISLKYRGEGSCHVEQTTLRMKDGDEYYIDTMTFYGEEISLPAGSYSVTVTYSINGNRLYCVRDVDLSSEDQQIELGDTPEHSGKVRFSWPAGFGEVLNARCETYSNKLYEYIYYGTGDIKNGEEAALPAGEYDLNMSVTGYSEDGKTRIRELQFKRHINLEEGESLSIVIGDSFTGDTRCTNKEWIQKSHMPGEGASFYFNSWYDSGGPYYLEDVSGNQLTYLWLNSSTGQLNGEFVLTNESGEEYEYFLSSRTSLQTSEYCYIPQDIVTGEYDFRIHMTTDPLYYTVNTATSGSGQGYITPQSPKIRAGKSKTFYITAAKGSEIQDVLLDNASLGARKEYTLSDIRANHRITAVFRKKDGSDPDPGPGPGPGPDPGPSPDPGEEEDEPLPDRSGLDDELVVSNNRAYMVVKQVWSFGAGEWTTTDKDIVAIGKKTGRATAKSEGKATIQNGKTKIQITVKDPVLSEKKLNLVVGETASLRIQGIDSHYQAGWASSNSKVAAVKNGKVTALGKGEAKVTAYVNGRKYVCTVKVTENYVLPKKYDKKQAITIKPMQTIVLKYAKGDFAVKNSAWLCLKEEKTEPVSGNSLDGSALQAFAGTTVSMEKILKKGKEIGCQNGIVRIMTAGASAGKLTAIGEGTTVLQGTDEKGNKVTLSVTVSTLSQRKTVYINKGRSAKLSFYKVKAKDAEWSSSSGNTAGVSGTGKVTGKEAGKSKVTCSYNGFRFEADIYVEDPALVPDARLTEGRKSGSYALKLGVSSNKAKTYTLKTKDILQTPIWKSSNPKVVFVDEYGRLKARKKGKAAVSAKINGKTLKVSVKVTEE
ncbi:MAG: Ig-like domain-containing protein [Lachnospiraceae bacterium]|nr:Ig-like domain-containing protein [Lachnospiraceae bacterium]